MKNRYFLAIVLTFCVATKSYAEWIEALEFQYNQAKKISATLGTMSQTRISFAPYSIKEIVGDSNKYKIIHDSLGMSIFIIPKVKAGEKIELTIITSGGKTQDFVFDVKDTQGSVILIIPSSIANAQVVELLRGVK